MTRRLLNLLTPLSLMACLVGAIPWVRCYFKADAVVVERARGSSNSHRFFALRSRGMPAKIRCASLTGLAPDATSDRAITPA